MAMLQYVIILLLLAVTTWRSGVAGEGHENESDCKDPGDCLLDKILDEKVYDRRVRPSMLDENGLKLPTIVNVTFALYTFIDMDETLEEGSAFVFIWEKWLDPRLAWDPEEYGGLDLITLETSEIWFPDVFLYQLATGQNDDKGSRTHARVQAIRQDDKYNAEVTLAYGALLIERCPLQMMYYPFDTQRCRFCMGAMASTNSQIIFKTRPRVRDRNHSTIGGEWFLVDAVGVDATYREFSVSCIDVTVKRRSAFFGINLFFPTVAVCLLNTIGLFSRLEETHSQVDIANLGQTTLLSLGVILLTIAADDTPKGAVISFMGAFFIIMICQSLVASITAICLRDRFNYRERRALTSARRLAKAKRQNESEPKFRKILFRPKSAVFTITGGDRSTQYIDSIDRGTDSDDDNEEEYVNNDIPKLIRWERICMWIHISFIASVTVTLIVIAIVLNQPVPEWRSM